MKLALIVLFSISTGFHAKAESKVSDAFLTCLDALSKAEPVVPATDFQPMANAEILAFARPPQTVDIDGTTVSVAPGRRAPDHGWVTGNLEIISWGADRTEECSIYVSPTVSESSRNQMHAEALAILSDRTRSGLYIDYPPAEIEGLIEEAILLNGLNASARCVGAYVPDAQTAGSLLMSAGQQNDEVCSASRELFR